jgi:hypothetical protein
LQRVEDIIRAERRVTVDAVWPLKTSSFGRTLSWWCGWKSSAHVVPTATKRILRWRFPGTCEKVGQVFKFVWRLCWKINVVCMSLSSFDSFQSRFVTYLLNCPRMLYWVSLWKSVEKIKIWPQSNKPLMHLSRRPKCFYYSVSLNSSWMRKVSDENRIKCENTHFTSGTFFKPLPCTRQLWTIPQIETSHGSSNVI